MLTAIVVLLLAGYPAAATFALRRRGVPGLLLACASAVSLLIAASVLLGRRFDVPSVGRLTVYALAFAGPVLAGSTGALLLRARRGAAAATFSPALAGAAAGLVAGYVLVVFGLGTW